MPTDVKADYLLKGDSYIGNPIGIQEARRDVWITDNIIGQPMLEGDPRNIPPGHPVDPNREQNADHLRLTVVYSRPKDLMNHRLILKFNGRFQNSKGRVGLIVGLI